MIAIIDYGMGNLGSIVNMLNKIGAESIISSDPKEISSASKLILPGVGAFDRAMKNLADLNLIDVLNEEVLEKKKPVLGICLGMQLLTEYSEEGNCNGLGWVPAKTVRFPYSVDGKNLIVPHMGWNSIDVKNASVILDDREPHSRYYFVHSFYVKCHDEKNVITSSHYGVDFHSAIINDNVMGVQFHPEKSHRYGFKLLSNFAFAGDENNKGRSKLIAESDFRKSDKNDCEEEDNRPIPVRVIPTLLLSGEGLVKTVNFKKPKYVGDPLNAVKIFNEKEVDELALLDINASVENREPNYDKIKEIVSEAFMPMAYGGGIKTLAQIKKLFSLGVEKVLISTAAVNNPTLIREAAELYGNQSVVGVLDVKKTRFGGYKVFTLSGTKKTGLNPVEAAKQLEANGAGELLLNSIDRDGKQSGFDLDLLKSISSEVNIPVIACGGASGVEDLRDAVKIGGASAVAAGSMFVFQGQHRAVLISYPKQKVLRDLFLDK